MGTDGVRERLAGLPGALTCAVAEDSVTLEALPGTDLRLLRARAEAVCAAAGDARSVVVVVGEVPPPPPPVSAGAAAALRRAGRPDVVATLSALVLAFVVLAPGGSSTPLTPTARTELAGAPSGGAEAPTAAAGAARGRGTGAGGGARGTTVGAVPDGLAAEAVLATSEVTAALTLAPAPAGRGPQRPAAARLDPAPSAAATPPATPAPAPPAVPVVGETPAGTAAPTTTVAPVPDDDDEAARRGGPANPPADARRDPPTPPATPATGGQPDAGAGRPGGGRP